MDSKGITPMLTPPSASPLSSVETLFGIIKVRYRKWLVEQNGEVDRETHEKEINDLYASVSKDEARKVARVAFTVYKSVLAGGVC